LIAVEMPTFSFTEFVRILLKNLKFIITCTIIIMIITAAVSFLLPRTYKATVTLLISESKMGIDGVLSSYFNPRFYYTFEGLVNNKDLALRAMKKFNLDKPPYEMKLETFLEQLDVGLVRNTRLINLSVAFKDPQMAADLANFIAQESVSLNQKINDDEARKATEFMREQVTSMEEIMEKNEKKLKDYKQEAKIKELETDVETLLYTKADLKLRLLDARIKRAEITATSQLSSSDTPDEKSSTMVEIDALITSLDKMIKDVEKELDVKQKLLAEREMRLESLMTLFDADQTAYRRINTRFGENATRVSEKFQEIHIIDPAVPPYFAEWPRKKLLTIIAGALTFLLSCGYVLLREQIRSESVTE
jgi:uncharacterized protein involved in exopolysaccharide biosynthesis